jgi:hypothetical protein
VAPAVIVGLSEWHNHPLLLYHGTIDSDVPAILAGVAVERGQPRRDFGRGFYTTTLERQAWAWARERAARRSGGRAAPAVVRFRVPRDALAQLDTLYFVRGDPDAADYWAFVDHCRQDRGAHRPDGSWYDIVAGPVTLYWDERILIAGADQIGLHTGRAAALLNTSDREQVFR